jgi:hypothetical protein
VRVSLASRRSSATGRGHSGHEVPEEAVAGKAAVNDLLEHGLRSCWRNAGATVRLMSPRRVVK